MGEEENSMFDRLLRLQERAMVASQAQQDPLVFVLTGKEIQRTLIDSAERYERAAVEEETTPIRSREMPAVPPGFPPPMQRPPSMSKPLRQQAQTCRFLAAHVEEERIFRLGVHDLSSIGLSLLVGSHGYF